MVTLQAISKIINTGNFSLVTNNALDKTFFAPFQDEFDFIEHHFYEFGNVPDAETFISHFPKFNLIEVKESDEYLLKYLQEEHLYSSILPILQQSADILQGNSTDAVDYLMQHLPMLNKQIGIKTTDILHNHERYEQYLNKVNGNDIDYFIPSGFDELDYAIHGWSREEEFIVMFARTNQGKSWIMTKTLGHAAMNGFNVGLISPEMSATKIGYRFDTLTNHFDNTALNWGKDVFGYKDYLNSLSCKQNGFYVSTPKDFGGEVTVNKIRTFIQNNNIQILGIDGLSYLTDARKKRTDNRQAELTHISEDLFQLSLELHVPIIGVVQANRDGVKVNGGNLELENIRDADGIAFNASKVIAIRQKADEEILELTVKKNRDGAVGGKFIYQWIPNIGEFNYIPSEDDGNEIDREEKIVELKEQFKESDKRLPF